MCNIQHPMVNCALAGTFTLTQKSASPSHPPKDGETNKNILIHKEKLKKKETKKVTLRFLTAFCEKNSLKK